MAMRCPGCGLPLDGDVRHCPNCDTAVPSGPIPVPDPPLAPPYYAMPQVTWTTGGRVCTLIGGVIVLIDGILACLIGLVALYVWEPVLGGVLLAAFFLSILGFASTVGAWKPQLARIAPAALVFGGIFVAIVYYDLEAVIPGYLVIIFGAMALALVQLGWSDLTMRAAARGDAGLFDVPAYDEPHSPYHGYCPGEGPRRGGD